MALVDPKVARHTFNQVHCLLMFSQTLVISEGSLPIYWFWALLLIKFYCIIMPGFTLMRCWPIFSSSSESELELEESSFGTRILHTVKIHTLDTLIIDASFYLLSSKRFARLHNDQLRMMWLHASLLAHLLEGCRLLHRSRLVHLLHLVQLLHLLGLSKLVL